MHVAMLRLAVIVGLLATAVAQAKPVADAAGGALLGPSFPVGNLTFTIPSRWQMEPVDSPSRGGQWRVPPLKGGGVGGEVVAFYFAPGVGGSAQENIEAWIDTMSTAEGHPADKQWQYDAGGFKVSQVMIFGTYSEIMTSPGIPPIPRTNYGLLGTVIENPAGNIYWRFTGPEPLVTATLPLFNKMIASTRKQGAK